MDRRVTYLHHFLGALGAVELVDIEVTEERVSGTVVYDQEDPEERQDFVWEIQESEAPNSLLCLATHTIFKKRLLKSDRLDQRSQAQLLNYLNSSETALTEEAFQALLKEHFAIGVRMVDDGIKSDVYFIHP